MRSATFLVILSSLGGLGACNKESANDPPKPETAPTEVGATVAAAGTAMKVADGTPPAPAGSASSTSGKDVPADLNEVLAAEKDDPPPPSAAAAKAAEAAAKEAAKSVIPPMPSASAEPAKTAAATTEPKPAPTVRGPAASDEAFSVWLETASEHAAGKPGTVTAVVTPKGPYKCNAEYPYKFQTAGGAGVSYPTPLARGANVDKKHTTLSIPFVAAQGGHGEVKGTLSFSVCTDERCLVEKRDLAVGFAIK